MVPEVAGSIPVSHPSFFLLDTIRMADILPIYGYGFSVLKRRAESIDLPDEAKAAFAESMFATMDASDGVGLAAPQVGVAERLFVIDSRAMIDEESDEQGIRKAFFNPEILEESGEHVSYEEGCLSIPGIRENVERQPVVRMRYQDVQGKSHEETFEGMTARVIQHEYDHIEGILFIDRINPLRKRLIKKRLLKVSKGEFSTTYKIKYPR